MIDFTPLHSTLRSRIVSAGKLVFPILLFLLHAPQRSDAVELGEWAAISQIADM